MRTRSTVTRGRPLSISGARGMKARRLRASGERLIGVCATSIRAHTGKLMWNVIGWAGRRYKAQCVSVKWGYVVCYARSGGKWGGKKKTWSIENKSTENLQVNPGDCSGDHCARQQVVPCFVCNLLCWNNYAIMLSSVNTSPHAWPWSIKTIQSSTPSQIITWQNNRSIKPFI